MDWILERADGSRSLGASFGDEKFTDLDFADDAVIFVEMLESLLSSLSVLSQESESLGLRVSWVKTKIQSFIQAVDQVSSMTCCGERVNIVDVFPYLDCQITPDGSSKREVDRRVGLAWGVMSQLEQRVWRSKYLSQGTKVEVCKRVVLPVLLYECKAWTLTDESKEILFAIFYFF